MAGFRLTTKVQVSGWRFLLRRVEHAIVRRDTRMFDDPLQFYSRAVSAGIVIAVLVCLGAALLAYFKPLGKRGGDSLLVDRTTNQLYVVMPGTGQLRPVYNLTSARLVLGNPGTPMAVKSDELNRMPKGQPIGIPGAPYATPVATWRESMWTLCDTVTKPESVAPTVETSVIVRPLVVRRVGRSDASRSGRAGLVQGRRLAGHRQRSACHRPGRPRRHVGGRHPGDREVDAHLRRAVQRAAERRTVAVAASPRRGCAEYPWSASESGDRNGLPDDHRVG